MKDELTEALEDLRRFRMERLKENMRDLEERARLWREEQRASESHAQQAPSETASPPPSRPRKRDGVRASRKP